MIDNFLEELGILLSSYPEDGTLLVVLGCFSIQNKNKAADFLAFLALQNVWP